MKKRAFAAVVAAAVASLMLAGCGDGTVQVMLPTESVEETEAAPAETKSASSQSGEKMTPAVQEGFADGV